MRRWEGKYQIEEVNAYQYRTLHFLSYKTKCGDVWCVPKGFITDGASIPRIFWSLIGSPFTGLYRRAALIHDYFYYTKLTPRWYADKIFLECMKDLGVSYWKRWAMWAAVRAGAGWIWRKRKGVYANKKEDISS